MTMTDNLKLVDKLSSENYSVWSVRMRAYLVSKGLWSVTDPDAQFESLHDARKSEEALALITLSLGEDQMVHIADCLDSKAAWQKLRRIYAEPSVANRLRLYEILLTLRLMDSDDVRAHVQKLARTRTQLAAVGVKIDDTLYKLALLRSLSSRFDSLTVALEAQIEAMSIEDLHARVYREDTRQKSNLDTGSNALRAHVNTSKSSRTDKSNMSCFYCKKKGHKIADCRKRKRDEDSHEKGPGGGPHALVFDGTKGPVTHWVVDSGASYHICNNRHIFDSLTKRSHPVEISIGDGSIMKASYNGTVHVTFSTDFGRYPCVLHEVLYIPTSSVNLLSTSQSAQRGYGTKFEGDLCTIYSTSSNATALKLRRTGRTYKIKAIYPRPNSSVAHVARTTESPIQELWHKRLGHLSYSGIRNALSNKCWGDGPKSINPEKLSYCISCNRGKMKNRSFKALTTTSRAGKRLELVHTDVCGPLRVPSDGGSVYFLTFIDDWSRMTFVYFLKQKSEVAESIKDFIEYAERQTECKVKRLRSDNGGEYGSKTLSDYLRQRGIVFEKTEPYMPQQNGVAERCNSILMDKARSMMVDMDVPTRFWADAVATAVHLRNLTPTKALDWKSPRESWNNKVPRINHLRVFGCHAEVFVPSARRDKLDSRSRKCMFIGYTATFRNYRFYDFEQRRVVISGRAMFYEHRKVDTSSSNKTDGSVFDELMSDINPENRDRTMRNEDSVDNPHISEDQSNESAQSESAGIEEDTVGPRRSGRVREAPNRLTYEHCVTDDEDPDVASMYVAHEPDSYNDAIQDADSEKWNAAMTEEFQALRDHGTWTLVPPSEVRTKLIECRWVFKLKSATRATPERHKARLVAKGFQQRKGVDFSETFAPVAKLSSLRLLLAHALSFDLGIDQLDVKNAFLNGDMEETVHMRQPEGFVDRRHPDWVCHLRKTLYGLKQAARAFYKALCISLRKSGLKPLSSDTAVFFGKVNNDDTWVVAYVDDLLVISSKQSTIDCVKRHLLDVFQLKDLGRATEFVGIAIHRDVDRGIMYLNQRTSIRRFIAKFGMENAKPVSTPMEKDVVTLLRQDSEPAQSVPYREVIGSLMYFATCTRPDIAYAVSTLAQFCEAPTKTHWVMVKRIMRYLRDTESYGLCYRRPVGFVNRTFVGYADADWAGAPCRKSTSGSALFYRDCLVDWKSRKQRIVALSTTEAEMIAVVEAFKEQKAVHKLFEEMTLCKEPWRMFCDNQACIQIAQNIGYNGRAKHIELRFLAVQDIVKRRCIDLQYCASTDNRADMLTKPLQRQQHTRSSDALCIRAIQ